MEQNNVVETVIEEPKKVNFKKVAATAGEASIIGLAAYGGFELVKGIVNKRKAGKQANGEAPQEKKPLFAKFKKNQQTEVVADVEPKQ